MTTTPELHELARDPQAFDTALARLHACRDHHLAVLNAATAKLHELAGDRKSYRNTRAPVWGMSDLEAEREAQRKTAHGDALAASVLTQRAGFRALVDADDFEIANMGGVYMRHGNRWTRFFPSVTKSQPHIHRSLTCRTLHRETVMTWAPQLSGKTDAEAVEELDEALCSVCFPGAPVALHNYVSRKSQAERDARATEKDTRDAAKALKNLTEAEQFRCDGDRITTVAACKELLRREVEMRDYYGRGEHPTHAELVRGADQAAQVLMAREARQAGSGAGAADIAKIIERAVVKNRKEGARI